jgi:hypothetical protein
MVFDEVALGGGHASPSSAESRASLAPILLLTEKRKDYLSFSNLQSRHP